MAKVTIEDISQETGLSRGTVSRAINNRPDISEATRARVLEACRKLNYRPSHAARSLATGRSFTVTVLYTEMDALTAGILRGVLRAASDARYFVHMVSLADHPIEVIEALPAERLDGFIAAGPLSDEVVRQIRTDHPAHGVVSASEQGVPDIDVIRPDYREGGRMQMRHIAAIGRRSAVLLRRGPRADMLADGVREVAQQSGIGLSSFEIAGPLGGEARQAIAAAEAVITTDDALAIDAMLVAAAAGRTPGADFALIGCGDEPIAAQVHPALTTLSLGGEEIGGRLLDTLVARVTGVRQDAPRLIEVAPTVVKRAS